MQELIKETASMFRKVNRTMARLIARTVSTTRVYRAQHQILMHIAHHPNASQAEIADSMEISPAALAVSLKKLEKGGYIVRRADTADERKKHIEMTALGNEIVAISHTIFMETDNQIFKGFSEEEIQEVNRYMKRMLENISGEEVSEEILAAAKKNSNKEEERDEAIC